MVFGALIGWGNNFKLANIDKVPIFGRNEQSIQGILFLFQHNTTSNHASIVFYLPGWQVLWLI